MLPRDLGTLASPFILIFLSVNGEFSFFFIFVGPSHGIIVHLLESSLVDNVSPIFGDLGHVLGVDTSPDIGSSLVVDVSISDLFNVSSGFHGSAVILINKFWDTFEARIPSFLD